MPTSTSTKAADVAAVCGGTLLHPVKIDLNKKLDPKQKTTVPLQNVVDLSFPTLVFLIRLSLKFYLINLKDSSTMHGLR